MQSLFEIWPFFIGLLGLAAGILLGLLPGRAKRAELLRRLEERDGELNETRTKWEQLLRVKQDLEIKHATLEERLEQERKQAAEKLTLLAEAEKRFSDAFKALSTESLAASNHQFLHLAKATLEKYQQGAQQDLSQRQQRIEQLTRPIHERLEKFDGKLQALEKARIDAYAGLNNQVKSLMETQLPQLRNETAKLVQALRQPHARGRWGEVQLRRVVEIAGLPCSYNATPHRRRRTGWRW